MRVDLATGTTEIVNAGRPQPFLIRDGRVERVDVPPDIPLGVLPDRRYTVHELALRPGDRLVLATDGMLERGAEAVDLAGLLLETPPLHPREAMPNLTRARAPDGSWLPRSWRRNGCWNDQIVSTTAVAIAPPGLRLVDATVDVKDGLPIAVTVTSITSSDGRGSNRPIPLENQLSPRSGS